MDSQEDTFREALHAGKSIEGLITARLSAERLHIQIETLAAMLESIECSKNKPLEIDVYRLITGVAQAHKQTATEIAVFYGVSKQAINQRMMRKREKLKACGVVVRKASTMRSEKARDAMARAYQKRKGKGL